MQKTNELNANERTENMKKEETKNKTCHEEKSSLPSIRGGVGRGDNSFETLKIDGFQKKISQHLIPRQTMLLSQHPLPHPCLVFADKRVSQSAKPIDLYPLAKIRSPERGEGKKRAAFTLAETLIALVILGIVAAITVPQLVRRQQEVANRTKFKKAVTSYESVMNKIAVMNDLKSNDAIKNWATKDNTVSDCSVAYNYFKSVKDLSTDSKCKFKTADGVYWDITDIQKPIISIKEADLTDAVAKSDTNRAFYLYAQYDGTGILRITEPNFNYTLTSDKTEVDASVDRLWAYLNGQTNTSQATVNTEKCKLKAGSETDYECEGSELTWKKNALTEAQAAMTTATSSYYCIWDGTECKKYDDNTSRVSSDILYTSEVTLTQADLNKSCTGSRYTSCNKDDYWNAYRKKCDANGAHLATAAELKALKDKGTISSGSYWAAETSTLYATGGRSYSFNTSTGRVNATHVYYDDLKAVCVGN